MKNVILYDSASVHADMLPLSFTRPVSDFRVGITTISEKWQHYLPGNYSVYTAPYLRDKFTPHAQNTNYFVAANCLPSAELAEAVCSLATGSALAMPDGEYIAFAGSMEEFEALVKNEKEVPVTTFHGPCTPLHFLYDLFLNNGKALADDYHVAS